jgi:hypothetical protein
MCIFAVGQPAQRPHQKLRGSPDRPRRRLDDPSIIRDGRRSPPPQDPVNRAAM